MVEVHGETGREWLTRLPEIISLCARRWSLTVIPPFEALLQLCHASPSTGWDSGSP
ncbi:MAG: hypothetical protein VCA17_11770 [Dehalococcoidia bacterium]